MDYLSSQHIFIKLFILLFEIPKYLRIFSGTTF